MTLDCEKWQIQNKLSFAFLNANGRSRFFALESLHLQCFIKELNETFSYEQNKTSEIQKFYDIIQINNNIEYRGWRKLILIIIIYRHSSL